MDKKKWIELNDILDTVIGHKELKETIKLIVESIKLSEELDEVNKKLQEVGKKEGK